MDDFVREEENDDIEPSCFTRDLGIEIFQEFSL